MIQKPNILLVVFDSLSARDLAQHLDTLPTLRAFADSSLNFTNAYTCCPESSPARASLFTGLDIAVHGVWTDGVALPNRETPLPEAFAAQGYQSWLVGRRQLAGVSGWTTEHARPLGYHHFDWAHGPLHRSRQNAYLTWLQDAAPEAYVDIFPRQADPDNTAISDAQRSAMAELPDALSFNSWVGNQVFSHLADAPFFGIAGFVVGQEMGAIAATCEALDLRALRQADAALADVLKSLPENTFVVVTAARGNVADAGPLGEAAIRVPLMIRQPKSRAKTIDGVVSTTDIAATLYAFADVHPPQRLQGASLMSTAPRGWALSRIRNPDGPHQTALVSEHRKLIVTHGDPDATRLYDLENDPLETHNLAAEPDHQGNLDSMLDLMIDARVALEDRTEPRIAKF
jgi:arylsulfatase A-like enzyme